MPFDRFFLPDSPSLSLLYGNYDLALVALSLFVAVLAGIMAFQLAGMARVETRQLNRQMALFSGAFVLGSGVWSMHFIGMLAYSVCSTARYDPLITLLSMLPSFLASWVALLLLTKERITGWQLVVSGLTVGAGIGVMHYSGMAAVHTSLVLRFDPFMFAISIVVAVVLSVLALWLRFGLDTSKRFSSRQINILSGTILGVAISGMHYTGMAAARFLPNAQGETSAESNIYLALSIAGTTILAILITGGVNVLLRYRTLYQRMMRNEARMRTIVDTAIDGIITIDSRGLIRAFNSAAEAIFGWQADEVVGRNISMLMPEPERSQHDTYLQNYLHSGVAKIIGSGRKVVGLRKDGSTFPLRLAIGKATLPNETLFVGFITDISERHQMEEALRNSEQQYRSLIGNLPGTAFRCRLDSDRSMLFVSDAVERLTGWKPEDFASGRKTFVQLLHPEDRSRTAATISDALNAGRPYMIEYRVIDRSGNEHWVSESASGVCDTNGAIQWIDGVIIDITESKRRNAEFEGVVNALGHSVAVIEFDLEGIILNANDNFLAITGYSREELVGNPHAMLCGPDEVTTDYFQLWETLRRGVHVSGDFHRIGKGGKDIWINGSYNPIFDPDGHPYKIIKFANDLSDRHAMEQDLREAKARAELAAEAKSTFLANMSHEIRTPMNAILGFTEVLLGEPASDTQRRHLNTVRNSARSLLYLLNDILDTAKLERGAVELEIKDFSLRDVCMQVIASLRVNAQAKSLPLVLDYPDREPEFFKGDALRIEQILLNLLGNAIKFTDRGEVGISVRHLGDVVHLVVSDTGIGIAPDRIARIFDPFAQADASMSRRFGGTGLGTTIARQLIEIMHGRIWVESELGIGSQFHVEVPLPIGVAVAVTHEREVIALPPLSLLIANDVPQNLELLQIMLGRLGHKTTTAGNGQEAVQAFANGHFDIVLMDVQMPILSGLDASRQIRRLEAETGRAPTPIIALTASVLEKDALAAREAGMEGFASKPVDLFRLTLEIARLLDIQVTQTEAPVKQNVPGARGSVIDWGRGKQLWGSEPRHRVAIRQFLIDFAGTVPRLRQLLHAPDELRAQVHRLRGAAANLALSRVASLSETMESGAVTGQSQELPALLDRLADELANVGETLGQLEPETPIRQIAENVDADRLLPELGTLDEALARGELPEASLAALGRLLPPSELAALDQAINAFDFDAARQVVSGLTTRYGKEGCA
ncbi:PAS domain S-box protein [Dechloromonas sp. CZR5]|uniref:PAS domain S-box protein n=1 Tax=Dechloromonas sp. CZR5 TaxID=2608630 RepID=UPI00123D59F5|nr:PAS domain S-box protein [Dechloromonas sp. CZR5]